jgi:hypothetical protein
MHLSLYHAMNGFRRGFPEERETSKSDGSVEVCSETAAKDFGAEDADFTIP